MRNETHVNYDYLSFLHNSHGLPLSLFPFKLCSSNQDFPRVEKEEQRLPAHKTKNIIHTGNLFMKKREENWRK